MSDETFQGMIERFLASAKTNLDWLKEHQHDEAEVSEAESLADAYKECATEAQAIYDRLEALRNWCAEEAKERFGSTMEHLCYERVVTRLDAILHPPKQKEG